MRNRIGIYINSSKRSDDVRTIKQMPDEWREFCWIVVPPNQYKAYKKETSWSILRLPKSVPGYLSSQRQWIMDNSEFDYVFMMDDDLTFQRRNKKMKLKNCSEKGMNKMLKMVEEHAIERGVPLVGISTRLGNNRVEKDYADIERVTRCYVVNKSEFYRIGMNLAPFEPFLKQDFHLTLTFLKNGLRNRVIYKYTQGDGSNSTGGCGVYRTPELMDKMARKIVSRMREPW